MKRSILRVCLCFFFMVQILALTGCSAFDKTFIVEMDYSLPEWDESRDESGITVTNLASLLDAIRSMVAEGVEEKTVLFYSSYQGNPMEDLASACWQVRTEDALCAYCVENIAYETAQILSFLEARLNVSYSRGALPVNEIISMPYVTELNDIIAEAISSGEERLAILISRSDLTADNMTSRFSEVYRLDPGLAPREPKVSVSLFSGTGTQRLYEIPIQTGLSEAEFIRQKKEIDDLAFPADESEDQYQIALDAFEYLSDCCDLSGPSDIYSALIEKHASSEGIALAYTDLCHRGGLECMVVEGQKDWEDYFWNIVQIDGQYYHVDLFSGLENGFLKTDGDFWGRYRWTINEYPKCQSDNFSDSAE